MDITTGDFRPLVDTSLPDPVVANCQGHAANSNDQVGTATDVNRDTCDVDAVRVCVERNSWPVLSFLSNLLGIPRFHSQACAVAYVGFASTIEPDKVDWPIAMCYASVQNCEQAQFINANFDTAVWTDYAQLDPCVGGTSRSEVLNVINSCTDAGNPLPLHTGQDMNTNDGMIDNVFELTYSCFAKDTFNPSGGGSTIWSGLLDQLDVDTSFDGSGASEQHPPQPNHTMEVEASSGQLYEHRLRRA